jgi:hypothetical protein
VGKKSAGGTSKYKFIVFFLSDQTKEKAKGRWKKDILQDTNYVEGNSFNLDD